VSPAVSEEARDALYRAYLSVLYCQDQHESNLGGYQRSGSRELDRACTLTRRALAEALLRRDEARMSLERAREPL
jgi:hypothetical protein